MQRQQQPQQRPWRGGAPPFAPPPPTVVLAAVGGGGAPLLPALPPPMDGAAKNVWGPVYWDWLHRFAEGFPATDDLAFAHAAYRLLEAFVGGLPCPECREHAREHFAARPPELSGPAGLRRWAYAFHETVNRRLGKPPFPPAAFAAKYGRPP